MSWLLIPWLAGCEDVAGVQPPVLLLGPTLSESPDVGGARALSVSTIGETCLSYVLERDGGRTEQVFEAFATSHDVIVVGLRPEQEHSLTVTLHSRAGGSLELPPILFDADPLPERFPTVEVLRSVPEHIEPGYRLMTFKRPDDDSVLLVAFDEELEPVWWAEGTRWGDLGLSPRGTLVGLGGGLAREMDLLGRTLRTWQDGLGGLDDVEIPWDYLHHELEEQADGSFVSLAYAPMTPVDAYPVDYGDPENLGGPEEVLDTEVVHFTGEGRELSSVALSDVLDTARIGYGSLGATGDGKDWVHANAVVRDPEDGHLVVSSRHQGAVFRMSPTGELDWILADPDGWGEAWQPYLLEPVGEPFRWPYQQHAVVLTDDGSLLMFDNGNYGCTPYAASCPAEVTSRAVRFEVDAEAGTVRQAWTFEETTTGPLYAPALSDADPLPTTGNVLVDYGRLEGEGERSNGEAGLGKLSVRLVEVAPEDGEVVLDVRFSAPEEVEPQGYISYRVEWLESFYP